MCRLSVSEARDKLLLKGALLFDLWFDEPYRPTRDVDFLGFGPADISSLENVFREVFTIPVEVGIVFDPSTLKAAEIRKVANYAGIRVTLIGTLSGARIPVQADIGFGDAVTPDPEETEYPVMLDELPAPRLRTYPRATVIAEKVEAITALGMGNSRMKDFFDLWVLSRHSEPPLGELRQALEATFKRRGKELPVGMSDEFSVSKEEQIQLRAFVPRNSLNALSLDEIVAHLREYLLSIWANR